MGQSYRIQTELGINKTINVQLDQEFEFLEILSLKIQQSDIYTRSCADYGVIVGRVTANNGFGLPNARVSIFIPIESVDESNPITQSIYPYKSPNDKNEDGYRYNLLPYEKSYSKHAATGTLPSRTDVLTQSIAVEIYDKYYKFTAKTNESGDYMIMGVPLGSQSIIMDVDLSDIGEFSLTPQDLIRMGRATEAQVAGNQFRTSTDLNSLPQIVNLSTNAEISPLWGDPDLCQIAINRVDFDLRDDANIDIQPTSTFMGSVYSTSDAYRVRRNCKPRDDMGNLCSLSSGPGQILAIRQTIQQDSDGNPILELYQLEQAGNVIDGSGVWLTELPMNLDYLVTNQFGEKVISNDPTIGIPTKAKYRFKIKWQQPAALTTQTRRPNYLVPNVKEYGPDVRQTKSSYYFGLAWSGYTNGFTGTQKTNRLNEAIDCEDTFYEFNFNKVYTVSGLIDEYKKGAKGRFIGIKEIDSSECESTVNKFPVNDGFRNFDLLFFIFSILMTLITPLALAILFAMHLVLWLYLTLINALCWLCGIKIGFIRPFRFICNSLNIDCNQKRDYSFRLPMITYPECQACDCKQSAQTLPVNNSGGPTSYLPTGILSYLSSAPQYLTKFEQYYSASTADDIYNLSVISSQSVAGFGALATINDPSRYKVPFSETLTFTDGTPVSKPGFAVSKSLPVGERINLFNQRSNFFTGLNSVKVTFAGDSNINKFHLDNTITVLSNTEFSAGDLLSTVSITASTDINWTYTADTVNGIETGISGQTYNGASASTINVTYATSQYANSQTIAYNLPYGSETTNYKYPADIEYFQVVTAITIADAAKIWNSGTTQSFPNVISTPIDFSIFEPFLGVNREKSTASVTLFDTFDDIENQYILILQRGVDPYSPKYKNVYSLGRLFGSNIDDPNFVVTANTRVNIPIQALNNSSSKIQDYSLNDMYYQSYFFKPGISGSTAPGGMFTGFNTTNLAYYGAQSSLTSLSIQEEVSNSAVVSKSSNGFYAVGANPAKYDNSEDVSGLSFMECNDYGSILPTDSTLIPLVLGYYYYTPSLFSPINTSGPTLLIDNNVKNIVRTDRLPTSDALDGGSFSNNPSILQQNNSFTFYLINTDSEDITTSSNTFGASQVPPELGDLPGVVNVLESFTCESMVGLGCYEGLGTNFQVNQQCTQVDPVENGCYVFMKNPTNLATIADDFATYSEWSFRFRFFYGLCRGVLSQSFVNNWVSGSLYMFPIQVDTRYNSRNQAFSLFCRDLVYFESDTNNFYYRSSPYSGGKFVGIPAPDNTSVNTRNLLFPTTIMNLGMKDYFYQEITFNPETRGYVMPNLDSTSYGDTSDLVNLFVISRITDEGFLRQIIVVGDNSLNQLFSRADRRIDGDLAQLLSINSEEGVIKFSPEYYETVQGSTADPVNILGTSLDPVMCVWFSSTTNDIQFKDFLTPGRINFRTNDNTNYYPYPYGIKSQVTPFYQWKLANTTTIFGSQSNTWATDTGDIVQNKRFQSLDRTNLTQPNYFRPSTSSVNDLYARGYIFSVDSSGVYSTVGATSDKFIVGAPFHFYFGTVKGESALDKFKTKYSIIE